MIFSMLVGLGVDSRLVVRVVVQKELVGPLFSRGHRDAADAITLHRAEPGGMRNLEDFTSPF